MYMLARVASCLAFLSRDLRLGKHPSDLSHPFKIVKSSRNTPRHVRIVIGSLGLGWCESQKGTLSTTRRPRRSPSGMVALDGWRSWRRQL
jgi:hypothetical protein